MWKACLTCCFIMQTEILGVEGKHVASDGVQTVVGCEVMTACLCPASLIYKAGVQITAI